MTPKRKKRLYLVILMVSGIGTATVLAINAFEENLMFYYPPAEVVAGKAPSHHPYRMGGLVTRGSVKRLDDGLTVQFDITDNADTVTVQYTGILPDLFREGQGIISLGKLSKDGVFVADEVLAKHDETYMPPEVADSLQKVHKEGVQAAQQKTLRP
jgi:cytochrome c-type biogenesis protein CcmE